MATRGEPVDGVLAGDGLEGGPAAVRASTVRAYAQKLHHLGPHYLDQIEVHDAHTAISHFFRCCGNRGLSAERYDNSEAIIKAHYRGRVSTDEPKTKNRYY